jgi:hypothetical protein
MHLILGDERIKWKDETTCEYLSEADSHHVSSLGRSGIASSVVNDLHSLPDSLDSHFQAKLFLSFHPNLLSIDMAPARIFDPNEASLSYGGHDWQSPLKANFVLEQAHGPLVWQGQHLCRSDFVVCLEEHEILELEKAVDNFDGKSLLSGCRLMCEISLISLLTRERPCDGSHNSGNLHPSSTRSQAS